MAPPLRTLLSDQRWDEARQKLKRFQFGDKGEDFAHIIRSAEDIPADILEILFSKYYQKSRLPITISDGFKRGCRNWSVAYLERFLRILSRNKERSESLHCSLHTIFLKLDNNFPDSGFQDSVFEVSSLEDLRSYPELQLLLDLWERIEILTRASLEDGFEKKMADLPFVARLIEAQTAKVYIWLALRMYPQQAKTADESGRLPLHWVASWSQRGRDRDKLKKNEKLLGKSMVEMLMEIYPEGASQIDKKGSYPLELILDEVKATTSRSRWCFSEWSLQNVIRVAHQEPKALAHVCPINRMLPFMTASCEPEPLEVEGIRLDKLNMTFALLVENPNVVLSGVFSTEREIWLTEKLEKAQEHIQSLEAENAELRKLLEQQIRPLPPVTPRYQMYRGIAKNELPPRKRKRTIVER